MVGWDNQYVVVVLEIQSLSVAGVQMVVGTVVVSCVEMPNSGPLVLC